MENDDQFEPVGQPTIKVSDFEGPLDLLLHLIRSSEMDIYDIQISAITEQYLDYLHQMQDHQLEVAGEYLVMAATLMSIKSKMLLPNDDEGFEEEQEDEEPIDPRQELVDQLLEYQRYKKAAQSLQEKELERQQEFTREAAVIPAGVTGSKLAPGLTLEQLQAAFTKVLKRKELSMPINQTVQSEQVSIASKLKDVFMVVKKGPIKFEELFAGRVLLDDLVTTFFAVLELSKHQAVLVEQDELFGELTLSQGPQSEEYEREQFTTN